MTTGYTRFALAGATGRLGTFFVEELSKDLELTILARSSSASSYPPGVTVDIVDYGDSASLAKVLIARGVEVVISALSITSPEARAAQDTLAQAARDAGVRAFVPSEFGNATHQLKAGPRLFKAQAQEKYRALGLDVLAVYNGPFLDCVFVPPFGFDWAQKKVSVYEPGTASLCYTTRRDIARFVVHLLSTTKDLPRYVHIEGDHGSFLDVVATYEKLHKTKVDVVLKPQRELHDRLKANPNDILANLFLELALGNRPSNSDNARWPEWNPEGIKDVLARVH